MHIMIFDKLVMEKLLKIHKFHNLDKIIQILCRMVYPFKCPESVETPRAANKPTIETGDLVQSSPIQFMLCNQ